LERDWPWRYCSNFGPWLFQISPLCSWISPWSYANIFLREGE
jgi:hypothetical protein